MAETKRYELDGLILDIPVHYDEQVKKYIEDYPDFIETPLWTRSGYRVLFSGTDSCREAIPGDSPDCGSCSYYKRAAERTWLGWCENKDKAKINEF